MIHFQSILGNKVLRFTSKKLCYKPHNIAMLPHTQKPLVKHIVKLYCHYIHEIKDIGTIPPK